MRHQIKTGAGAAGPVSIGLATADSVRVGQASIPGLEIGITEEIQRIASAVGAPIQGALGFPFLRKFCMVLNYQTRTLELSENYESAAPAETLESLIDFHLASVQKPLILVPVWLNDRGPYQFALDTGASTTVISCDVARELGVSGSRIPNITGGGGDLLASAGMLDASRLATRVLVIAGW